MAKRSVKCNQLVPVSPFTWHEKCTLAMRLNQILVADVQILDMLLSLFQIKEKYWNTKFTWKMKLIWIVVCVFEKGSFQRNKTFKGALSINLASHRDDECMENSTCQTIFYGCSVRLQPVELINSQSSNLHTFTTPFEKLFVPKTQSVSQSQNNGLLSSPEADHLLSHRGYIVLQDYPGPFLLVEVTECAQATMTNHHSLS